MLVNTNHLESRNDGLASGITIQMGKAATVDIGYAVFGPMMNVTGSMLASWWKEKPCD